jgi:hypothetical protein
MLLNAATFVSLQNINQVLLVRRCFGVASTQQKYWWHVAELDLQMKRGTSKLALLQG